MIRLKNYMRLKISNRLAATAALMLLVSSVAGTANRPGMEDTATLAQEEQTRLEGAVADLASVATAVGQSTSGAFKISSLIFRF